MKERSIFLEQQEIKNFCIENWDIGERIDNIVRIPQGTANLFKIQTSNRTYVLKEYQSSINIESIQYEIEAVNILSKTDIPAIPFLKNKQGNQFTIYKDRILQILPFIQGDSYYNNELEGPKLTNISEILGKIVINLKEYNNFPLWRADIENNNRLGKKIEKLNILKNELSSENKYPELIEDIDKKIKICKELNKVNIDFNSFSWLNSHGDYSVIQLLFKNDEVCAVFDFARVTKVPIAWEIVRSFTQSAKPCKDATININELIQYINTFQKHIKLTKYDLENMLVLYLNQLAPTSYGYKEKERENKQLYRFGRWRTKLAMHIFENYKELSKEILRNCC